jgi:regulator of PEP synthase PpsR (kinase-PPPase family)
MRKSKDIYYISDGTGIVANNLGKALICQFPGINFNEEKFSLLSQRDLWKTASFAQFLCQAQILILDTALTQRKSSRSVNAYKINYLSQKGESSLKRAIIGGSFSII